MIDPAELFPNDNEGRPICARHRTLLESTGMSTLGECWICSTCEVESEAELKARMAGASDTCPPPELYDDAMATGTWPSAISKEMAEEHWAKKRSGG